MSLLVITTVDTPSKRSQTLRKSLPEKGADSISPLGSTTGVTKSSTVFVHPNFKKGRPELLRNIVRSTKNVGNDFNQIPAQLQNEVDSLRRQVSDLRKTVSMLEQTLRMRGQLPYLPNTDQYHNLSQFQHQNHQLELAQEPKRPRINNETTVSVPPDNPQNLAQPETPYTIHASHNEQNLMLGASQPPVVDNDNSNLVTEAGDIIDFDPLVTFGDDEGWELVRPKEDVGNKDL